jgi:hypothetical protein
MSLRGGELDTHRQRHRTSNLARSGKRLVHYPVFLLRFVYLNLLRDV